MALTPEQRMASYRDVLRTFRPQKAPALMGRAVGLLRVWSRESAAQPSLDLRVAREVKTRREQDSIVDATLAKTIESTHELVKFVAGTPADRARNRVLNSLDRANSIKFFGPVRHISVGQQAAAIQQVAAEAASLAPVRPEVLAGKIRHQQKILRALDAQIKGEKVAARKKALEAARRERLREAAALLAAAKVQELSRAHRFKPFNIKRVPRKDVQQRASVIVRRLRSIETEMKRLQLRMKTMKPGAPRSAVYSKYQQLATERSGLHKRLRLLRSGRDRVLLRRVQTNHPRPQVLLPAGVTFRPAPELTTVIVRYLAQRIPRRVNESRRHFLLRLRIYVQRALARFAANSAAEPEPVAAAEAAAVATITDDSEAIESEVDAGGVAEDPAADAMAEVVEELTPVLEEAAADLAPETVTHSESDEFISEADAESVAAVASMAPPPAAEEAAEFEESGSSVFVPGDVENPPSEGGGAPSDEGVPAPVSIAPLSLDVSLPEEVDQALDEAFETLDLAATPELDKLAAELDGEVRPWFKNPVVLGGAALAALLILRS